MKATEAFLAVRAAGGLSMTCIEHAAGFRALQNEWHVLHASCPGATLFNSWEWLFSWWQAYGSAKRLRLLTWRVDGALVGVAPLYLVSEKTAVGTPANVLRMLGDGSGDSDYLQFLLRPDLLSTIMVQFGQWLVADRSWDALALRDLPQDSTLPDRLGEFARQRGLQLRMEHGRCAAVELPPTFDEFLRGRQPRFRTKVRSLLKKLDEGDLSLEAGPRNLRTRLRSLFALHQARWRAAGVSGVFDDVAKRRFYAHFVTRFARRGWLRFYSLRHGSAYVAHELCFGRQGDTYLLQEGFDVSDRSASYGQMLRAAIMRRLIDNGEGRYDFLGGFSRHKEDWGAREGRSIHLLLARPRWRGWVYFKLPVWREQSASAAKRFLPESAVRMLKRTRAAIS